MGLTKHYLRIGRRIRRFLLGNNVESQNGSSTEYDIRITPISMLISQGATFNNSK